MRLGSESLIQAAGAFGCSVAPRARKRALASTTIGALPLRFWPSGPGPRYPWRIISCAKAGMAVVIYRRLMRSDLDRYRAVLAQALNTLVLALTDLGQRRGALSAAREAVELDRRLAQTQPDTFQSELAPRLTSLGTTLRYVGDAGSLTTAHGAVTPYRKLAARGPATSLPRLGTCLGKPCS